MAISRDDIEKSKTSSAIRSNDVKKEISQLDKETRENKRINERVSYISNSSSLLGSIIIILVAVAMIRILYNGTADGISFRSLLDLLSNAPQVSTVVKNFVQQLQIPGPWVILDGLRLFLNLNLQAVSIVIWLSSSLIDVCIFLSYFLMWLFL